MTKPTPRAQVIERLAIAGAFRGLRIVGKRQWKELDAMTRQAWKLDANLVLLRIQRAGLRITLAPTAKKKAKRR